MPIEVRWLRDDAAKMLLLEVDGIIVSSMLYVVADKFQGLAPAMLKAAAEWAQRRDAGQKMRSARCPS
jgi:hypothetical protein